MNMCLSIKADIVIPSNPYRGLALKELVVTPKRIITPVKEYRVRDYDVECENKPQKIRFKTKKYRGFLSYHEFEVEHPMGCHLRPFLYRRKSIDYKKTIENSSILFQYGDKTIMALVSFLLKDIQYIGDSIVVPRYHIVTREEFEEYLSILPVPTRRRRDGKRYYLQLKEILEDALEEIERKIGRR